MMILTDLLNSSPLSFARKAAMDLVIRIWDIEKDIPEEGEYKTIYSEVDAKYEYGEGWKFLLSVQWQGRYSCHWLELTVYHLPMPYKCSILLSTGKRVDILKILHEVSLVDRIEKAIPRLHDDLADI